MKSIITVITLFIGITLTNAQPNGNDRNGFTVPINVFLNDASEPFFATGFDYEHWMNDKFSISGAFLLGPGYFRISPGIWGYAMLNTNFKNQSLFERALLKGVSIIMLSTTEAIYYNINLSGHHKNMYLSPYVSGMRIEFLTKNDPWIDWRQAGGVGLKFRSYIKKKFQVSIFGEVGYHFNQNELISKVGMTAGWSF